MSTGYVETKIASNPPLNSHYYSPYMEGFVNAYVFIRVGNVDINEVKERLLRIKQVVLVHLLIGPTDIITYIETSSLKDLQQVLDVSIRQMIDDGSIINTTTEIVLQKTSGRGYSSKRFLSKYIAWQCISLSKGSPEVALEKILSLHQVKNAHAVLGKHDVIAMVETNNINEMIDLIDVGMKSVCEVKNIDTRLVLMGSD